MWTICGFNATALGARETSLSETVGNRLWQDFVPSVSQHCQGLQNVDGKVLPWETSIKTCNQLHEVCISVVYLNLLHNPLVKGLRLRGGVWGQEEKLSGLQLWLKLFMGRTVIQCQQHTMLFSLHSSIKLRHPGPEKFRGHP